MLRLLPYTLILSVLCLLTSCGEDDYYYPPVKLAFLTATTSIDGTVASVVTDDHQRLTVADDKSGLDLPSYTSQRIVANYEQMPESDGIRLYGAVKVVCPTPLWKNELASQYKDDPVEVISIWPGNGYLNMILGVKETTEHTFHFSETSKALNAHDARVDISLHHDAHGGTEAYLQRCYLSIPLEKYEKSTQAASITVAFSLNTYTEGVKTYTVDCPFYYVNESTR